MEIKSVNLIVLEFLYIWSMESWHIWNHLSIFSKLPIKCFIFLLPPLLIWLSFLGFLIVPIIVEKLSLFFPQIIKNTFVCGQLKLFVLFSICNFSVILIDHTRMDFKSFTVIRSLNSVDFRFEGSDSLLQLIDKLVFSLHIVFNNKLILSLLQLQSIKSALILCMNNIVLLWKRVLCQSLHMVRTQIPFLIIRYTLTYNVALIVTHWKEDWVSTLSFTIISSRFFLEFYFFLEVIIRYSFLYISIIMFVVDELLFLFYFIIDCFKQKSRNSQRICFSPFNLFRERSTHQKHRST